MPHRTGDRNKRCRRGKSDYRKYFISYCCIALIPVLIVGAAVFFMLRFHYANTSQELYRRIVTQFADHLDALIREYQTSVNNISLDMSEETERENERITAYLRVLQNSHSLRARTCYYAIGSMNIHTADGVMSYQEFEERMADEFSADYSSFFTRLNSALNLTVIPLYTAPGAGNLAGSLAVLVPYYGQEPAQRGVFAFIVDSGELLSAASDYIGTEPGYFYLYSSNLTLLYAWENMAQEEGARLRMIRNAAGKISSFNLGGESWDVLHMLSNQNGLHIVAGVHLERLYFDSREMSGRMVLILLPTMGGLILLAYALARYSYRPIRKLLNTAGGGTDIQAENGELEYIDRHLKNVQTQMKKLNDTIASQQPYVRTQMLAGMLRGRYDEEQAKQIFPEIAWGGNVYAVLTVPRDRNPALLQAAMREIRMEDMTLYSVWLEGDECFAFICLPKGTEDQRKEQCLELSDQLLAFGLENPRLYCGGMADGIRNLPGSFLEAYIVLNNRKRDSGERVYLYEADDTPAEGGSGRASVYDLYLQSLRSVDYSAASTQLENLLSSMNAEFPHGGMLNTGYMRYNLYVNALSACEPEAARQFGQEHTTAEAFSDEEAFAALMRELTRKNCAAVEERRKAETQKKRDNILKLIQEHGCEPDFSLGRLSEMAGYSPTYINRFLRDETGLTYIQVVSGLRMEKARALLTGTDLVIRDIVTECGYMDLASFTRKFKEYAGVTPGEYRAQQHKE